MKLIAFKPFTSAANALEQINAVSESQVWAHSRAVVSNGSRRSAAAVHQQVIFAAHHIRHPLAMFHVGSLFLFACAQVTDDLKNFLTTNLPKVGRSSLSSGRRLLTRVAGTQPGTAVASCQGLGYKQQLACCS